MDLATDMLTADPRRDALLVVDCQHDFLPGGALAVPRADAVLGPIGAMLPLFRTVVATQDFHPAGHVSFASRWHRPPFEPITLSAPEGEREQMLWPDHCVAGTHGAEITAALDARRFTLLLRKGTEEDVDSYSAFRENLDARLERRTTGLGAWLRARGIARIFLAGLAFDYCVSWSAKDAREEGFEVVVVRSATAAVFPANDPATAADLSRHGIRVVD